MRPLAGQIVVSAYGGNAYRVIATPASARDNIRLRNMAGGTTSLRIQMLRGRTRLFTYPDLRPVTLRPAAEGPEEQFPQLTEEQRIAVRRVLVRLQDGRSLHDAIVGIPNLPEEVLSAVLERLREEPEVQEAPTAADVRRGERVPQAGDAVQEFNARAMREHWARLQGYVIDDNRGGRPIGELIAEQQRGEAQAAEPVQQSNEELVNLLVEIQEIIEAAHPSESELISKVAEAHDLAACTE